jgi:signal transduction histidine kinase
VPLELAELAAGLPFAVSFAMAGGISALREGRRRTALNEAVHELRRPLQAMALSVPASAERAGAFESSLRMATAAVDRLDCEINGRSSLGRTDVVPLRPLVESAVERWQVRASLEKRALSLKWEAGDPRLPGDAVQLGQVLDNLISNGLDHGSGEVAVEVKQGCRVTQLVVANEKRVQPVGSRRGTPDLRAGITGRHRHGHGLRIVRRVAARHGGSFHLRHHRDNCEALLELPLCGGPR